MKSLYLVTGAAGHLGSTIMRLLAENGCSARGLLLPAEHTPVEGMEYVSGNILAPERLGAFLPVAAPTQAETLSITPRKDSSPA